jgi:hypothetical protein
MVVYKWSANKLIQQSANSEIPTGDIEDVNEQKRRGRRISPPLCLLLAYLES